MDNYTPNPPICHPYIELTNLFIFIVFLSNKQKESDMAIYSLKNQSK